MRKFLAFGLGLCLTSPVSAQSGESSGLLLCGEFATCLRATDTQAGQMSGVNRASAAEAVTLESLVREALENNRDILAARRRYDAAWARVAQQAAPPEPMITVGWMGNLSPFSLQRGDPSSARILSFSQEIPFPGKLPLQSKAAWAEAQAALWDYELTWRQVVSDLKVAYFDLSLIDASIEIVGKTKDLLQQFLKIAEARYQVGKAAQQDVLKAQTEISILLERMAVLEQRRASTVAFINSILYRPPETPLGRLAEVRKGELRFSLEELYHLALQQYPGLKQQERIIDRGHYTVARMRKDFYPDFAVSFQYLQRPVMPEMWGWTVSVKVPLYFWKKQRPALEEAASDLAAAKQTYEQMVARLFFQVKDRYLMATTAERLLRLYGEGIIPQATLTLESSVASYQVGAIDFLTLLTNVMTVLTYELNYYEQLTAFQKSLAELEPLIGRELVR